MSPRDPTLNIVTRTRSLRTRPAGHVRVLKPSFETQRKASYLFALASGGGLQTL
jgi:hypothetical protein